MKEAEPYIELRERLNPYYDIMIKAADAVVDQDVSNYPIFVVHDGSMELGLNIIHDDVLAINLSTLEEFSAKKIFQDDKLQPFMKVYNDAGISFCILDSSLEEPAIVFIPKPTAKSDPSKAN